MSNESGRDLQRLEELNEIILSTVDNVDAMLAYWDVDRICRFANAAYREWFGKGREQLVGLSMEELLGHDLYSLNRPHIDRAYAGETQTFEREVPLHGGATRHSLATYTPHFVDGKVQGLCVHVADVTPLKALEHELEMAKERAETMATHDYLTGLPNRVMLNEQMSSAIARAKRNSEIIAIMTIDMDGFKQVNDNYGHGEGDRVLVQIASRMRRAVREADTVTRYGGDEFLITAPQVESKAHTATIAERLLAAVREPVPLGEGVVEPTFSIGIAFYPDDGATPEELITRSDKALYIAKRRGKNRYAFYSHE